MKAPLNSSEVTATVTSETSVDVTWIPPSSSGTIASYRVDRYTKSAEATAYSSFFGDAEVQTIKSSGTNVSAGTFTLSYDSWDVTLPGTVSALNALYYFNTTVDLTSYLEPGDQVYIDGAAYTIATGNLFTNNSFYVKEAVSASVTNADISGASIKMRPKTLPIPYDVTPTKMIEMLENTQSFGQVNVERTVGTNVGYEWTVPFLTNVGDQPSMIANNLQLLGVSPEMQIATLREGASPDNYAYVTVPATSSAAVMSTTFSALT